MSFDHPRLFSLSPPCFTLGRLLAMLMVTVAGLAVVGCGAAYRESAARAPGYPLGYVERGIASWYGPGFHGNLTANGERYNMHSLTAAHRTLPMGSVVEVQSLTNDRRVVVRINDRGPFIKGRIIDLSRKAADALNMTVPGTDEVEIRVVGLRGRRGGGGFLTVQVGSFEDRTNAWALKAQLERWYSGVKVIPVELFEGRRYRVQVGQFRSEREADALAVRLASQFDTETLVIRDDT